MYGSINSQGDELDYHIYKSYQVLGMVGKGTYGQVYKVKSKREKQLFAIKKICDAFQNLTDAKRTYRQLNYLFQLQHPCIVKLFHIIPADGGTATHRNIYSANLNVNSVKLNPDTNTSRTYEAIRKARNYLDEDCSTLGYITEKNHPESSPNRRIHPNNKHVYAVFEFVESDLSKALRLCSMQPIQRKYIAYQLLNGIQYLHNCRLIHRDIKPSNILIDSSCDIKICDFGLCRIKSRFQTFEKVTENDQNITEYVASRWYRPPEILLGFSRCDQSIDIWGVGCVLAEIVLRSPIFQGGTTMDQLQKIFRVIGLPSDSQINKLQIEHAKFILRNFTFSRKNKPTRLDEVLSGAAEDEIDLISKLLRFDPVDRLSAEQALKHPYFREMAEMNYQLENFNYPVKIVDQTCPQSVFGQGLQGNSQRSSLNEKTQKKKEFSLEQYQAYVEDLERFTSRSSNRMRGNGSSQGYPFKDSDRVLQSEIFQSRSCHSKGQEISTKQKSTRESNFAVDQLASQNLNQQTQQNQLPKNLNSNNPNSISTKHHVPKYPAFEQIKQNSQPSQKQPQNGSVFCRENTAKLNQVSSIEKQVQEKSDRISKAQQPSGNLKIKKVEKSVHSKLKGKVSEKKNKILQKSQNKSHLKLPSEEKQIGVRNIFVKPNSNENCKKPKKNTSINSQSQKTLSYTSLHNPPKVPTVKHNRNMTKVENQNSLKSQNKKVSNKGKSIQSRKLKRKSANKNIKTVGHQSSLNPYESQLQFAKTQHLESCKGLENEFQGISLPRQKDNKEVTFNNTKKNYSSSSLHSDVVKKRKRDISKNSQNKSIQKKNSKAYPLTPVPSYKKKVYPNLKTAIQTDVSK